MLGEASVRRGQSGLWLHCDNVFDNMATHQLVHTCRQQRIVALSIIQCLLFEKFVGKGCSVDGTLS